MTDGPSEDRAASRGLQNERTALAWTRTALSVLGVGALVAKQSGSTPVAAAVLATALVASVAMLTTTDRHRHRRQGWASEGDAMVALPHILATTSIVAALALVAAAVVVT